MSKITVGELKKIVQQTEYEEEIEFKGLNIKIKKYLPIKNKIELAMSIYESAVEYEDGTQTVDTNYENIAFAYYMIKHYTNITLPKSPMESFDILISTGIFNAVVEVIEQEAKSIMEIVHHIKEKNKEKYEQKNTLQKVIVEMFSGLNEIAESFKDMDIESIYKNLGVGNGNNKL